MCENGEILADDGLKSITVTHFRSNHTEAPVSRTIPIGRSASGHGGGDSGIMEDLVRVLSAGTNDSRSSISRSVESHLMACAIEESRLTGQVVDMEAFRKSLL